MPCPAQQTMKEQVNISFFYIKLNVRFFEAEFGLNHEDLLKKSNLKTLNQVPIIIE